MESQDQSDDIKHLTSKVINVLVQRTGGDPRTAVNFVDVYEEACMRKDMGSDDEYDKSNPEMRQHVRDRLLRNEYIFVDPKDVDSIFLTQKAIDEYKDRQEMGL
jgi:hypothetical protein